MSASITLLLMMMMMWCFGLVAQHFTLDSTGSSRIVVVSLENSYAATNMHTPSCGICMYMYIPPTYWEMSVCHYYCYLLLEVCQRGLVDLKFVVGFLRGGGVLILEPVIDVPFSRSDALSGASCEEGRLWYTHVYMKLSFRPSSVFLWVPALCAM